MGNFEISNMQAVEGGFALNDLQFILNSEEEDTVYKVMLGTGTYQLAVFYVDARDEQTAVDRVVDFCEENEYAGLYSTYEELEEDIRTYTEDESEFETELENLALISCGNSGLYIDLQGVEEYENAY